MNRLRLGLGLLAAFVAGFLAGVAWDQRTP